MSEPLSTTEQPIGNPTLYDVLAEPAEVTSGLIPGDDQAVPDFWLHGSVG